ncbi:MAG: bifunctional 4-hydroxy-2-oxoglutarate aldolase/2-dehydro-3-deoxy-phosphogluconate aldolase [Clostridia bacterium]|nr:bifunctional 4-hydroxy-2-oxoglutarate aldolase/2-dehydro-3-deoxy-phosphogluconate aldolase [Clostridia bacterium]
MSDVMSQIQNIGIVPVVKLNNVEKAIPLCEALIAGGINVAEVTFRTECASDVIKTIARECKDMIVGAGTIINVDQAKLAIECGAKFIVSPGFSRDIVEYCQSQNIPVIPGCITPSEIMQAIECGLNVVKFFPAKEFGGLSTMKSLSGPFGQIKFMPTGGVNLENLKEFISAKFIVACGGTYMVKDDLINSDNYEEITRLSRQSIEIIKEARE